MIIPPLAIIKIISPVILVKSPVLALMAYPDVPEEPLPPWYPPLVGVILGVALPLGVIDPVGLPVGLTVGVIVMSFPIGGVGVMLPSPATFLIVMLVVL